MTLLPLKMTLTPRQQEVLDFIHSFHRYHGMAPTIREMMKGLGIGSPNGICCHLKALEAKGHLKRVAKSGRGMVLRHGVENDVVTLLDACRMASAHVRELRDAWERGAINEIDGKGGERSNRNADVDVRLRAVIEKHNGGQP